MSRARTPPESAVPPSSVQQTDAQQSGATLASIDISPLDELARIRRELDTLETRLRTMEGKRESVAAAVYARVRDDYEQRRRALEHDAAPLKASARASYAQLRQLLDDADAAHETTRLDREEIDFRFSLGEFDEAEHVTRVADVDRRLAQRAAAREEASALRQRFVDAFGSEDALEHRGDAATVQMKTLGNETLPPPPTPPPAASTKTSQNAETVTLKTLRPDTNATQVMRTLKRGDDGSVAPRSDQTLIMRTARLLPKDYAGAPVVIALKPILLGSGADCDVKITAAQPHHAEIRASMAGFTLTDQGGGVRINGVAVEQHLLRQGDELELAGARFEFSEY